MKKTELVLPEIGLIAATRAMLGAGIGLLVASRLSEQRRRVIGGSLVAVGVLTTIPLLLDVLSNMPGAKRLSAGISAFLHGRKTHHPRSVAIAQRTPSQSGAMRRRAMERQDYFSRTRRRNVL